MINDTGSKFRTFLQNVEVNCMTRLCGFPASDSGNFKRYPHSFRRRTGEKKEVGKWHRARLNGSTTLKVSASSSRKVAKTCSFTSPLSSPKDSNPSQKVTRLPSTSPRVPKDFRLP